MTIPTNDPSGGGPPADLLIKCLELTASNHDGEALAAIRKANLLRAKLGRSWAELINPVSSDPAATMSATRFIDWPAVFSFIREWNPPSGKWARFLDSVESQFDRKGRLTPKQRRAILKFYDSAHEKMREFEEAAA